MYLVSTASLARPLPCTVRSGHCPLPAPAQMIRGDTKGQGRWRESPAHVGPSSKLQRALFDKVFSTTWGFDLSRHGFTLLPT
ncbi:uncharacterized protein BO80DRAFT_111393 [Aspergillus ibericus CBS 121593]|uniref:Uncharacterized protein n=1 Tax=Aspergillus ibericus CBS 121593 TaxID=1448316 RepID=A0A395GWZ6_9EURO|nr:hypothetical protein BO80DRAFT_111393 [Aspergillus ibericus CBS 121593]RAK99942.1 hypothetical protein BO80DRAFT_111393 [Aspergillus ibericus CBS 121593]